MVAEEKLVYLLQSCRNQAELLRVAAQSVVNGLWSCSRFAPKIVSAFFDHGRPEEARRWFSGIPDRTTVLWNIVFKGHTQRNAHRETLILFSRMRESGAAPNRYTFTFVLKSCAKLPDFRTGISVHCVAVKTGFDGSRFVGTLLVDLYSVGEGDCESAWKVFEAMPERNVVAWTAIVAAYLAAGEISSARRLFEQAGEADIVLWNTMICGYISVGDLMSARDLFDEMPHRDIMAWNTLLHGYAIAGELEECSKIFETMPKRNAFSWNGLIRGYLRHERFSEALSAFTRMVNSSEVSPNEATVAMALSACAKSGALAFGRRLHFYARAHGFMSFIHVVNGIIDMYAKCGSLNNALRLFDKILHRDLITWNIAIGALAAHGKGPATLRLFQEMKEEGLNPDGITFVGVLSACSHMGLVHEGLAHFKSMVEEHKISPWMEHYGCLVDLFCRAGLLEEALDLAEKMPMDADCVIWTTLLGACRAHKSVKIAELAAQRLCRLVPDDAANFVALSNVYGAAGDWAEFARTKVLMREGGSEKSIGCSLVEIDSEIVEFCSSDWRHERTGEIHEVLAQLRILCGGGSRERKRTAF